MLFAVVVGVSLVVLFAPGPAVPEESWVSDKVVHAGLFAALALSGRLARVPPLALVAGLAVYAGVSEVLQGVLPIDRDGDVRDVVADLAGVAAGLLLAVLSGRLRQSNV